MLGLYLVSYEPRTVSIAAECEIPQGPDESKALTLIKVLSFTLVAFPV